MKPRAHHRVPPPRPPKGQPAAPGSPRSRTREWLFRLAAVILVPAGLFGVAELSLRLAGYGHATGFFEERHIGDRACLIDNEHFSERFFPPELARTAEPLVMSRDKSPDAIRIFILGESAAMGDPEPAFGAARYLEVLLRERFPARKFEVINTGITAINSHVILPIARDCARQHGDLWIIYMGNNEMVGPYGAATIFGAHAPPLWLIRSSLALERTRVGQGMMALLRRLGRNSSAPAVWTGMHLFEQNRVPPDDPKRQRVHEHFRRNLDDILRAGVDSGAAILLNTVAVNLRDCPPFASQTNLVSGANAPDELGGLLQEAERATATGNEAGATAAFARAVKLAPNCAMVQYQWAASWNQSSHAAAARERFQLACDLDTLPFRADSGVNAAIRETAARYAAGNVRLFDAAATLATNNVAGVPGSESFYEHVHLNFDGNYRLARAWAGLTVEQLHLAPAGSAPGDWASQEVCERRLALTDWNRAHVFEEVIKRLSQPPLSTQLNNRARRGGLESQLRQLQPRMDQAGARTAAGLFQEALQRQPEDRILHANFADFLIAVGNFPGAATELQRARELAPQDVLAQYKAAVLQGKQGQFREAEAGLRQILAQHPFQGETSFELGEILVAEGRLPEALMEHERTLRLRPQNADGYYQIGKTLVGLNRRPDAIVRLREATRLRPDFWQAHFALGAQLALENQLPGALQEFEAVLRLQPDYAPAHLNQGVALMKSGQFQEAAAEFAATLKLDPANASAARYYEQARAAQQPR